jgi:MFS transporter, DHA2 family, glioxin efflux transporter
MVEPEKTLEMVMATRTSSESETSKHGDPKTLASSHAPQKEKVGQSTSDDEYPHGLRFILPAGASVISVFLIALDQVSNHTALTSPYSR